MRWMYLVRSNIPDSRSDVADSGSQAIEPDSDGQRFVTATTTVLPPMLRHRGPA